MCYGSILGRLRWRVKLLGFRLLRYDVFGAKLRTSPDNTEDAIDHRVEMARRRITPKQEAFAQAVVDGLSNTDAYRAAGYKVDNMSGSTLNRRAYDVAQNGKVTARIKQLRQDVEKMQMWSRRNSIDTLKEAIQCGADLGQPTVMVMAVRELNRMHGFCEPEVIDLRTSRNDMSELSDAELLRIVQEAYDEAD